MRDGCSYAALMLLIGYLVTKKFCGCWSVAIRVLSLNSKQAGSQSEFLSHVVRVMSPRRLGDCRWRWRRWRCLWRRCGGGQRWQRCRDSVDHRRSAGSRVKVRQGGGPSWSRNSGVRGRAPWRMEKYLKVQPVAIYSFLEISKISA